MATVFGHNFINLSEFGGITPGCYDGGAAFLVPQIDECGDLVSVSLYTIDPATSEFVLLDPVDWELFEFGDCSNPVTSIPVCYETVCQALGSQGAYTTAPDSPEDFTALSLTVDLLNGTAVDVISDPAGVYTWRDYFEGGRLEELIAGLPYATDVSWVYNPDDGENTQIDVTLFMCVPDAENFGISFNSGDATVTGLGVQPLVYESEGTLVVDVVTGQQFLVDCFGEPVDGEYTIIKCDPGEGSAACSTPTSQCMCYRSGTVGEVVYANDDNTTDISASQNTTTIKWELQPGQEPDADALTQAIKDCINSGEVAHITWTDVEGTTVLFDADSIISDSATANAFGGTSTGSWAGKLSSASLVCGEGAVGAGKACLWVDCVDGVTSHEWRDQTTQEPLTLEQVATLHECCTELCPECPTSTVQTVVCVTEPAEGVTVGDRLLLVGTVDCEGVLQTSTGYNLDNANTLVDPIPATEACDPSPEVEEIRECLIDTAGQQWTQLVVINVDGTQSDPIFINNTTLGLGTPAGEPAAWTSCVATEDVEIKDRCFYSTDGTRYKGCEVIKFDGFGNYLESSYIVAGTEYLVLPEGLRGPFDCEECLNVAGCFDPRLTRFNSVTFEDGTVIDLDAIYGVDAATTNDVVAEVTGYAGGTGDIPTEYSSPPSILCKGTNLHEFQFTGISVNVVSISSNNGEFTAQKIGACGLSDAGYGVCGGSPTATAQIGLVPDGVCDDSLLAGLLPTAGVKTQIKIVRSITKTLVKKVSRI